MKTNHRIIIGDSRWMKEVPDESVHLIITSPPYWKNGLADADTVIDYEYKTRLLEYLKGENYD